MRADLDTLLIAVYCAACSRLLRAYVDSSSLVKLVLTEEGSESVDDLWETADALFAARTTYIEARAAIARAQRDGRLSTSVLADVETELTHRCGELEIVELDAELARAAGDVAERFRLRGYDALHLAAAIELEDPTLVFVTWDGELRQAALDAGLAVAP